MDIKGAFKKLTRHKIRHDAKEIESRMRELKREDEVLRSQSEMMNAQLSEAIDKLNENLNKKLNKGAIHD